MDITGKILLNAEKFPDRTAYIYGGEKISYGELSCRAKALAGRIGNGPPAIIYGHRSPVMIIGILSCLICGREYIPCDISIPAERLRSMITQSGADTAICECDPGISGINKIFSGEIYSLPECKNNFPAGDKGYIIFTSGSTGSPKGIRIPRESLENFIGYGMKIYPDDAEIFGGHALFSFDLSVADIFIPLVSGKTFHAFDDIPEKDINVLTCTPTYLRMCLLSGKFSPENYPGLKTVLCCGETLPPRTAKLLLERFENIRLINAYGPSECCCFVCAKDISLSECDDRLPIGTKNFTAGNVDIRDGEIFISGKSAAGSYINDTGGFRDGGFFTGDLGKIKNGLIFFDGRKGSGMIKYSGYRIETEEIESVLSEADGIKDCFVSAVRDSGGEVLFLKAQVNSEKEINVPEIKKFLSARLPRYMIPKIIEKAGCISHSANYKKEK